MTEIEYRSHPAISRSELWRIHNSPEKFKYFKEHPEEPTPALLFGQVFHKMALEPDTFDLEFVVMPDVDRRTKEGKQLWAEFQEQAEGKTVIPAEMHEQAKAMCESLAAVPFAQKLLNGRREAPFFWVDESTGEECKCRTDCLNTPVPKRLSEMLSNTDMTSRQQCTQKAYLSTSNKPLFLCLLLWKKLHLTLSIFCRQMNYC